MYEKYQRLYRNTAAIGNVKLFDRSANKTKTLHGHMRKDSSNFHIRQFLNREKQKKE